MKSSDLDYLIFRIVYNYRRAIEVTLKHLLMQGCELLDRDQPNAKGNRHSLVEHWRHCRPIVEVPVTCRTSTSAARR